MTATRVPVVSGPVHGGRGWPFGSPLEDLEARGYLVEEFFLTGTASSYVLADGPKASIDGMWSVEPADEAAYVTRAYVVRPVDPNEFNGAVIVNWQNVTIGVDFGMPDLDQLERGYAWVGVTTQRVAMEGQPSLAEGMPATTGLRAWDPERYSALSHPGDAYSYDIFSQAGRLLRDRGSSGIEMLGGLEPRLLIATGGSQSAMRLGSYINIAHQRDRVFDGFLLTVHWGICPPPPDMGLVESWQLAEDFTFAGSARIRDDGGVPILVINSESETLMTSLVRQADTDTFRFWEMAGTAHGGGEQSDAMTAVLGRDGIGEGLPEVAGRNTIVWDYVARAAMERLVEWIETGRPPASIAPIELDPAGAGGIRRDAVGNAVGGVRLPELVAPLATHSGTNTQNPLAALMGKSTPLPASRIAELYRDYDEFLKGWEGAVDDLANLGLVLPDAIANLKARGRFAWDGALSSAQS